MPEPGERDEAWRDEDAEGADTWQPLTAAEAQALRERQPAVAPSRIVVAQVVAGAGVALLAWLLSGRTAVMASALYGAVAVALPTAVMVGGLARPLPGHVPLLGAVRLLVWEAVKLLLAVAMLALAPLLVQPLSWPALLLAMVVCLKVYWVALLWRGR